jgi:predicted phosphoribosyltransferase
VFQDRADAGVRLAERLASSDVVGDRPVVLGLPRGGIPVAAPVARALGCPLDVFVVRKLGVPGHEELAMGAIATGGIVVRNEDIIQQLRIDEASLSRVEVAEGAELRRRELAYRGDRKPVGVAGRDVVIVDDGIATGASMRAAVAAVTAAGPRSIVVAVPVASRQAVDSLAAEADAVVALAVPEPFGAVGSWYRDFTQTSDTEVGELLSPR